ncbi:MAG: PspC domain-containing protein [Bacteroidia bacterium]|nr:PspC domain-containing protein [Bacteroidia bacterium]
MARERYRSGSSRLNDDFDTSLMYDDIEKIRNMEEEEEKDQNNKLGSAGMMAFVAGASMLLGVILTSIPGFPSAEPILRMLEVFLPAVGVGALGYGLIKMVNLVFRRKELNFPALNVYRKTKPAAQKPKSSIGDQTRTRDASRQQARERYRQRARSYVNSSTSTASGRTTNPQGRKMLRRSRANRVFSGVAGGISEYTGASVSLIRFAFVAGLFIPPFAPMTILLYLLLSIVLPANFDPYNKNKGL